MYAIKGFEKEELAAKSHKDAIRQFITETAPSDGAFDVTVVEMQPMKIHVNDSVFDEFLGYLLERLDEDYGVDCVATEPTNEMRNALREFAMVICNEFPVRQYEPSGVEVAYRVRIKKGTVKVAAA